MEYFNRNQAWPSSGSFSGLPAQAIPSKNKTEKWFKETMDALEYIGLKQMDENQKFKDFYRMKDGKLSFMELKDIIPYLRDVQDLRSEVNIPSFLKHYDLLGTIVNAFVGWLGNMSDKYNVVGLDETEVNQYTEMKDSLFKRYIQEELDKRIRQELLSRGIDPEYNNFQSEEEREAYVNQLNEMKASLTPPEIENYMNTRFKTRAVIWGSNTLDNDRGRFYMDELDEENYVDYLLTGRCFRNFHVGFDYYKPERWSPLNTFYSKTLDSKYPQYGEYIGRVHYYTSSDIIARWGHLITGKDKQRLVGGTEGYYGSHSTGHSGGQVSMSKAASLGMMYQNQVVPFKNYHDYASIKSYENYTGIPQGIYTGYDSDGNMYRRERFLPNLEYGSYQNRAQMLSDSDIRSDLYQVTECYWVSPQQIYILTYQSETGLVSQEIVTDELLQDFLRDNGIKKITRTMKSGTEDPEVNTYYIDYVPQVRYGVKISGGGLNQESLYLDGDPIEHQIKGDSNIYDFILPVAGYIGTSLAEKIQPYQILYNFSINQIRDILEREIGTFFLTDINFIPSEYKNLGEDIGDVWANLLDAARATGALALDTSAQNTKGGVPFNQFAVYDLSQNNQIKSRMEIAEFSKMKCYEMCGVTQQALSGPSKYETATGVKQGMDATFTQVQIWFDHFNYFKRRALDLHLAVAQQCQTEGKDISVLYTKSDMTKSFLDIGTDELTLRHLGVMPITNSKKRQELESFKNYMLQLNTAGGDIYDLASIFTSDSMVELTQAARNARKRQDQMREEDQQHQLQLNQQNIQAAAEEKEKQRQHELAIEDKKGYYRILEEQVQAAGRAADSKADPASLNFLAQTSQQAIQKSQIESDQQLENRRIDLSEREMEERAAMEREKLELEKRKLDQRDREDQTKRFVASINKN